MKLRKGDQDEITRLTDSTQCPLKLFQNERFGLFGVVV